VTSGDRPSDDALWASVAATLRDVVLPQLDDEFARAATIQLIGLAGYARARGDDPAEARIEELRAVLGELPGGGTSVASGASEVLAACADALVAATGRDDEEAATVRNRLRPVLLRHLDEDLAGDEGLLGAFRGRPPDG
jgi:hypothetical protein